MPDNYSIFDTYYTFDSLFDIYPDKIHTGAVYGYRKSDGTLLEFPCTLDVSKAVKDDKGRWTASGLGLKAASVKYSDSLKRTAKRIGAKEAWIGEGFAGGRMRSPSNNTIEEVRFLDDVTSIGCGAFEICTALTSVTIPNSVTSIGDWAFYRCTSLTSIAIPNSVTSIEDMMFLYCSGLTSVVIPNGVKSIGYQAFLGCTGLTSITIPDSVTKIGEEAFWGCESLTDIYVNQAESTLLDSAFVPEGCTIHWNPMTVEQVQNYTLENARELAVFAKEHDICVLGHEVQNVYDLNDDEDNDSIAEIVGDILKCSKSKHVYDYLRQAFEGDARFVWEVNGFLVPFTENDLEQLKEAVLITLALGA